MVAWLASDEALYISGQVFRAVGSEIAEYDGWRIGRTIVNKVKGDEAKWDPEAIGVAIARGIYGTRPGGLQMGGG